MTDPRRQVVRENRFEEALQHFEREIGMKVAVALVKYDEQFVAELRERVALLESPFPLRWYYKIIRRPLVQRILRWIVVAYAALRGTNGDNASGPGVESAEAPVGAGAARHGDPGSERVDAEGDPEQSAG